MKIFITFILAIILNFFSVNLFAQNTWQDVGPNNGFSAGNAFYTKIASNSKGELFVAYQDVAANGITVKHFEQGDNTWYTVGTPGFSSGQISKVSLAINQDTLYVSYMTSGGSIVVQKFNGTSWQILGGVIASQGDYPSLAFNPTNNSPYIAYSVTSNSNKGTLKKYDKASNTWNFVNSTSNYYSSGGAYYNSLAFKSDGTPMIAFKDDASWLTVQSYYIGNWSTIGTSGFASGITSDVTLKVNSLNNFPYVSFKDVNSKASVYSCSSSWWSLVGTASFTNPIAHLSLDFDNSGKPLVAFGDQGNSSKITVMNFYSTVWTQVGTTFSSGGTDYSDIIIQNNTPIVVFPDNGYTKKAVVKKFSNCALNIPSIAGNSSQYCVGSTPNSLTATSNAGYSLLWWGENAIGGTSIAASITPDISTVGVKSYYVSQTDGAGCNTARAKIDINTVNKPTATISSSNTSICSGNSGSLTITLTGTPPFNFSYNDGTVNAVAAHYPFTYIINTPPLSADKTHELLYISDNLCNGEIFNKIVTFNVTTPPIASFTYPNSTYCKNTTNPSAVLNVGSTAGTFSSSAGLAFINTATGKIDLVNSNPGTYVIKNTIAPSGGCGQVVDQFTITIIAAPVINTPPANANICVGGSNNFNISASGGSSLTYQWMYSNDGSTYSGLTNGTPTGASYANITTSNLSVLGVTATGPIHYYKCIVNDISSGCTSVAASATLTVNANPIATFSYTGTPYCANASNPSPTFSGGGVAGTFSSTSGLIFINANTGQVNLLTSTPGTYTVTNTVSAPGCTNAIHTKSIKINNIPTATLSGNANICAGSNTNLNVSLTGTSSWDLVYTDGTTPITITGIPNSPYSFSVSPSSNKTYTISSITDASTCAGTKSGSAIINIKTPPTAKISGDTTICAGSIADLKFDLTGNFPLKVIYSDGVKNDTIFNITSSPFIKAINTSSNKTYSIVSVFDGTCEGTFTGNAIVTVNQLPTGTITGNSTICKGSKTPVKVTLTGLGPWGVEIFDNKNNDTLKSPIFASPYTTDLTPTESNTYTLVSIKNLINNCKYIGTGLPNETVNVIVKELPTAIISGDTTICTGQITPLKVTFTGTGPWDLVYTDGTTPISITGISNSLYSFNVNPPADKTYNLTSVSSGGCVGTASGIAIITTRPKPNPISFQDSFTSTCKGNTLNPYINTTSGSNYKWFVNNVLSTVNFNFSYQFNQLGNNTINVVETDKFGCVGDTISKTIVVEDYPLAPTVAKLTYCQNESSNPLSATINANCVDKWYNSLTGGIALGIAPTPNTTADGLTYFFVSQKTKLAGCESPRSQLDVTVNKTPSVTFPADQTIIEGNNTNITLTLDGTPFWNLTYTNGTASQTIPISTPTYSLNVNPTVTTTYTPTSVTDANGCVGTLVGNTKIIVTPNLIITQHPIDVVTCEGLNTSFEVIATNASTYKWQVKTNGASNFVDITDAAIYSGINTNKLTLTGVSNAMNQYSYHCIVNSVISNQGILTVNPKPKADFTYSSSNYCQSASNPSAQLMNGGVAGIFSCTDPNLKFSNISTGEIDLMQSLIGDYIITNTISAANGCATISSDTISIASSQGRKTTPTLAITGSYTNCSNSDYAIKVTNDTLGATYQWFRNGRMIVGDTNSTISLATYGEYSVNDNSCLPSAKTKIDSLIFGIVPRITINGKFVTNSASLNSNNVSGTYQWYINDYLLLGENNQTLEISFNGKYKIGVTNDSCTLFSEVFEVDTLTYPYAREAMQFNNDSSVTLKHDLVNGYNIVPNPSNGAIHIIGNNMTLNYKIIIKNIEGAKIYEHENILSTNYEHNIADFPTGLYIVELIIDNTSYITKLVKN